MQKLSFLFLFTFCISSNIHAQGLFGDPDMMAIDNPASNTNPYNLSPEQYNHHFEYKLQNDGTLQIDFLRLSDWGTKNRLAEIVDIAAEQVDRLKDSFRSDYSEKLLEMNIPINNKVLMVNYHEDDKNKNQLAYKNGTYYQLKTGFDTIRIVKNIAIKSKPLVDSGIVQIQYTFVLKDINDIQLLKDDPAVIEKIGNATDSVINKKREQWSAQDARHHQLDLYMNTDKDSLSVIRTSTNKAAYGGYLGIYCGLGAIVYNNQLSYFAEVSLAYLIPTRGKMQGFVGLNANGFGLPSFSSATLKSTKSLYTSYNAEIGICKKGIGFMSQKTSFLLGVMTIRNEKPLFNFGFNLGINRFASIGLNIAGNYKKEDKGGRYVTGINFKFNL